MDSRPTNGHSVPLKRISLSYNNAESESSALRLVYAVEPKWREEEGEVKITKFTDGITNNVSLEGGSKCGGTRLTRQSAS
jgi:ethanolamine kinase